MVDLPDLIDDPNRDAEEDYIFSDYAIDDTLDPLHRLVRYYQSDFSLQRLVLVRELCDTAHYAGYEESVKMIVPLLSQFTSDPEPGVRQTLIQQLHPLAKFFVQEGGEEGYEYLLKTFLPMGFELLVDKNVNVGSAALDTILAMADLVRKEDVQAHLLNVAITLGHDERAEDYRVVAAQLFNDLAPKFGEHYCTTVVLPELELLSNDSSFPVRRTVGGLLGSVCKVIKDASAQDVVISLYLNLCQDDTWGVRQACAEAIEQLALSLPEAARVQHLVPAFRVLLEDDSRWVRDRAYENLGRLIHTLPSEDISTDLLKLFTDMAFSGENGDTEYSVFCAFCFPAVVEAIGRDRWPEVEDAYATMLKDVHWKVRKSLAYSLHELAVLLGTDLTEMCIVPAFELFLRDLDDIKRGVVLNVRTFLKMVRPTTLARLVPLLCHVPLESENWRLRNEVAKRIGEVAVLLPPSSPAFGSIIALVLRLLDDSVIKVRNSTYRPAAVILKHLDSTQAVDLEPYLETIVALAKRPSFQGRQMFAYLAQHVVEVGADDVVEGSMLNGLLVLAGDSVSNVRIVVEKVVRETLLTSERWRDHAKVTEIMQTLRCKNEEEAYMQPQTTLPMQSSTDATAKSMVTA